MSLAKEFTVGSRYYKLPLPYRCAECGLKFQEKDRCVKYVKKRYHISCWMELNR